MPFEHYIRSGNRLLRCGYTTGTCAALASAAAARLLLSGTVPETVQLLTPKGLPVEVTLASASLKQDTARCAVRKDAGDDPDVTDGLWIYANVCKSEESGIQIDGGTGVGRVTKPGLDQPVGAAAINHVPRSMIQAELAKLCTEFGYTGGLSVLIEAPGGEILAEKTFNPKLGILGGISILGSSGIVEPMSEQALLESIHLELKQLRILGHSHVILTPGHYGEHFLSTHDLATKKIPIVKCSNFIGDSVQSAATLGFQTVLLVGHIGKLIKLAGGMMHTHSKYGDCRCELFCAHAALAGASQAICQALMQAATSEACLTILKDANLNSAVLQSLLPAIAQQLNRCTDGLCRVGAILFSNQHGLLGQTEKVSDILGGYE